MISTTKPRMEIEMGSSPLWQKALERYNDELGDNVEFEDVLKDVKMDDLIAQVQQVESKSFPGRSTLKSLSRMEPMLTLMNDFTAVGAICFGADSVYTALVWGSLRLILKVATPAGEMLRDILDMLEDIILCLPRFKNYEKLLPINESFESCLLAVYTEMICFCARTIKFFRENPHNALRRNSWAAFDGDFQRTIKRIKKLSQIVESEADIARMQVDTVKNSEVLKLIEEFKEKEKSAQGNQNQQKNFLYLPDGTDASFYGRENILEQMDAALHSNSDKQSTTCFALCGMGGVGKTQIALQYAKRNRTSFNTILWIPADDMFKMSQSFLSVARELKLFKEEQDPNDSTAALLAVKTWLAASGGRWLVVFDNADDLTVLKHAWPSNSKGSILLTTRDPSALFSPATHGCHVQPFDEEEGASTFLCLCGQDYSDEINQSLARDICKTLGGLPLALSQMGGFIMQQRLSLEDFLPLYERNAAKIDAKKSGLMAYEHTLDTVWVIALAKLPPDAKCLQRLISFLDPDKIHESILTASVESRSDTLAFLEDEMDFMDAKESLLQSALINRDPNDASLSVHRLVQAAVIRKLSAPEKGVYLGHAVSILQQGFPDTWSADIGHQVATWGECEKRLPHVVSVMRKAKKYNANPPDLIKFAELLLRGATYCYEREMYNQSEELVRAALPFFDDRTSRACASATDLLALIKLDLAQPLQALPLFEEALEIRKTTLGERDPMVAFSFNNLALVYTETGDFEKAMDYHKQALSIRLEAAPDRIGNTYSNLCSLLVCMGKPDEAEITLMKCPSLKDFSDEIFLSTGNPRFSGDMILLSRIRAQQNRLDDAIRLSAKALAFRRDVLGNRMKVCDTLTQLASQLHQRGNLPSAVSFLEECIAIAATLPEGTGYLARASWKLASLQGAVGRVEQEKEARATAQRLKLEIAGADSAAEETDEAYEKLVARMLW